MGETQGGGDHVTRFGVEITFRPSNPPDRCSDRFTSGDSGSSSASSAAAAHACITVATSVTDSGTRVGTKSGSWAVNRSAVSSETFAVIAATCPPDRAPSPHADAVTDAGHNRFAVRVTTVAPRPVITALRRSHAVWEVSPSRSHSVCASKSPTAAVTLAANRSCIHSTRASATLSAGTSSSSIASASTSNTTPPYARGVTVDPDETQVAHGFRGAPVVLGVSSDGPRWGHRHRRR